MPTRAGLRAVVVALVTAAIGRIFAIPEAFALAVAVLAAAVLALGAVGLRPVRVEARRSVEPEIIHTGDRARVHLELVNRSRWRNPPLVADLAADDGLLPRSTPAEGTPHPGWIPPLRRDAPRVVTAPLDTSRRGRHTLPAVRLVRSDPLGLAVRTHEPLGPSMVTVLPRIAEVPMPVAGSGVLGDLLVRTAERLGLGEFAGLRVYVDGDDPRAIHWRASARREDLMVRQFEVEGARRCTIVLDCDAHAAATAAGPGHESPFEVAVEITATLVTAALRAGLLTRLVISNGPDLRGPGILHAAVEALTVVQPGRAASPLARDGAEGLGLFILISPAVDLPRERARALVDDPTLVAVRIATGVDTIHDSEGTDPTLIRAPDLSAFIHRWQQLVEGP